MSNIIILPTARGVTTPLDLFLRIGEAHHGQIAGLYDEGRLPLRRAIFDASRLRHQLNFLSHFGSDATSTGIRALITLLDRFHNFGHPVVIDHVGGLVGRALLAFGVAGGIAHGLDEHLQFDASPSPTSSRTGTRGGRPPGWCA